MQFIFFNVFVSKLCITKNINNLYVWYIHFMIISRGGPLSAYHILQVKMNFFPNDSTTFVH